MQIISPSPSSAPFSLALHTHYLDLFLPHFNHYFSLPQRPLPLLHRSLKKGNPEWKTIEMILNYLGYEVRLVKSKKKTEWRKRVK
jgi:hypothetical protein